MTSEMVLYNTLSKKKELFQPIFPGKVGMYVCGPTVYGYVHIGNWRSYVFSDTLRRVLEYSGYEVRHIMNITDVGHLTHDDVLQGDSGEDKISEKAKAESTTPEAIAEFYTEYFEQGRAKLNMLPAHFYPRATAHITAMIRIIQVLIQKGHAYAVNGSVFYDVTSFPEYGKLSGNRLENLEIGARLEAHPDKKNPWDFALWLNAPESHLMKWPSPWSFGYPGWHIECSAMSQEYLGETFDIHTGGEDNIFPHHEAEIAQSEGATEKTFSNYFLHARHMMVNGQKMSKSKGNIYTLEDLAEKGYDAMDLRITFLGSHYRSQMNFTFDALHQGKKIKEKFFALYSRLLQTEAEVPRPASNDDLQMLVQALHDDLNTPLALSEALKLLAGQNKMLDEQKDFDRKQALQNWQIIFSLFGLRYQKESIPEHVYTLAQERDKARKEKNWGESDHLRDELEKLGYLVKDLPNGFELLKK